MSRALLFTGGRLGEWALPFIHPDDTLIGADSGALFLLHHGLRPHIAVGDFDSVSPEEAQRIRESSDRYETFDPVMKDYTDTDLAIRLALEQQPTELLIFGAIGTRFDHSLANVHLLLHALRQGIPCRIIDECNEIQLTDSRLHVTNPSRRYRYVSLLPLSAEVQGVTLEGFQYPLNNATLTLGQSLAISNVLLADTGTIQVDHGLLLVIQSKD